MPKINIRVSITNQIETKTKEMVGTLSDQLLKYRENDLTVILNYEKDILTRENKDYKIKYDFKNDKGSIHLKDNSFDVMIPIKTIKKERKNNDIKIEYQIEEESFLYQIEEKI